MRTKVGNRGVILYGRLWLDLLVRSVTASTLLQCQPLGFDTKYLALRDRIMHVRFCLKVVWVIPE